MFKHILVPVDGSASSLLAVGKAANMAATFDSAITLVHVMDPYPFHAVSTDFAAGQAAYEAAANRVASDVMDEASAVVEATGVTPRTQIIKAHVIWRGILDVSTVEGADLIVMGSQGRNALEKLVLGSVAQRVVSHASVPVMVVRE